MATLKVSKTLSSLPNTLEPDTIYYVRVGVGFDLYVSDDTGQIAHKLNDDPLTWSDLATRWDSEPVDLGDGVYRYTLDGVERFRRVPDPYVAAQDTFFADQALTQPIVSRGS